jgi:hypothetical protein
MTILRNTIRDSNANPNENMGHFNHDGDAGLIGARTNCCLMEIKEAHMIMKPRTAVMIEMLKSSIDGQSWLCFAHDPRPPWISLCVVTYVYSVCPSYDAVAIAMVVVARRDRSLGYRILLMSL